MSRCIDGQVAAYELEFPRPPYGGIAAIFGAMVAAWAVAVWALS